MIKHSESAAHQHSIGDAVHSDDDNEDAHRTDKARIHNNNSSRGSSSSGGERTQKIATEWHDTEKYEDPIPMAQYEIPM